MSVAACGEAVLRRQQTLAHDVEISGRGLHSGVLSRLRLIPADACSGIRFRRVDLPGAPEIPATLNSVGGEDLARCTRISSNGVEVHTVEHLLAALYALGIDNLTAEINACEMPFLDGSSQPFVEQLHEVGISAQEPCVQTLHIPKPLVFRHRGAEIVALPSKHFRVSFFFSSQNPLLRAQSASMNVTPETFSREIAPARTFCFFEELEELRRRNLIRGGSLASAVVIGRKALLNESLRFNDEPVRHKILDFIGDLSLLGRPVRGHFLAWRSGHNVNAAFGLYLRKELGFV